jgi:cobalt-zinc-cadmium resistance protein CzcA
VPPANGAMTYNDEGEVAGAIVMMFKGNSNDVITNVKIVVY